MPFCKGKGVPAELPNLLVKPCSSAACMQLPSLSLSLFFAKANYAIC